MLVLFYDSLISMILFSSIEYLLDMDSRKVSSVVLCEELFNAHLSYFSQLNANTEDGEHWLQRVGVNEAFFFLRHYLMSERRKLIVFSGAYV